MKKKPHDRILRDELKQQYLNIVPKSYSYIKVKTSYWRV